MDSEGEKMRLKHLRHFIEQSMDTDGETAVVFADNPETDEDGMRWRCIPVRGVFQEANSPVMFVSNKCADKIQEAMAKDRPEGYGVNVKANADAECVIVELRKLEE